MPLRYLLAGWLLLAALAGHAQPKDGATSPTRPAVRPPLTAVTIFYNGTQLEHRTTVPLTTGVNRVTLDGLSYRLDEETLEVQFGEGVRLLSVDDEDAEEITAPPLYPAAVDSLISAETEERALTAELEGLKQEKAFLLANQTLPAGTQAGWSAELQKGAALMRTRLPAIQQELARTEARLGRLATDIAHLKPRASENGSSGRRVLVVQAERAATVPLTVRYFLAGRTGSSAWRPRLDIRASQGGREVRFVTHGLLSNRTGLPWQRVRLTLARYAVGDVNRPVLAPWELSLGRASQQGEGRVDEFRVKGTAQGVPTEQLESARYEVPLPVTLAVNARRDLTLPGVTLRGQPEYLAVPRMAEGVILQTKVAGWQGLQLPDRPADLFNDGVLVGSTSLEDEAYNDSLEIALGRDPQLVVGRAKLEDFSSNVPLSDKRRVRLTYELNVQNRHPEEVRLRLLDEVPISEDKEISVKVLEKSGAELEERTGKLTWLLRLPPGSSRRLQFSFQVDYPKDTNLEIINHRTRISSPKFR